MSLRSKAQRTNLGTDPPRSKGGGCRHPRGELNKLGFQRPPNLRILTRAFLPPIGRVDPDREISEDRRERRTGVTGPTVEAKAEEKECREWLKWDEGDRRRQALCRSAARRSRVQRGSLVTRKTKTPPFRILPPQRANRTDQMGRECPVAREMRAALLQRCLSPRSGRLSPRLPPLFRVPSLRRSSELLFSFLLSFPRPWTTCKRVQTAASPPPTRYLFSRARRRVRPPRRFAVCDPSSTSCL